MCNVRGMKTKTKFIVTGAVAFLVGASLAVPIDTSENSAVPEPTPIVETTPTPTPTPTKEKEPTPEPVETEPTNEQQFLEAMMTIDPSYGDVPVVSLLDLGYNICDSFDNYGVENTVYALADAATDDTDIKIAGETMTSAGYFLCPEHRDELDSYLDNN